MASMKPSNNPSADDELTAEEFAQRVAQNPVEALRVMRKLQNQARQHVNATSSSPSSSAPSPPPYIGLDPQSLATIAQIVAQTLNNQPLPVIQLPANPVAAIIAPRFAKFSDIPEYESVKH
jgi:CRP-like cAMP-binding protein